MSAAKTILEHNLPCVVAITKADVMSNPESRRQAIAQQLLEAGLFTEEFGGEIPVRMHCVGAAGTDAPVLGLR